MDRAAMHSSLITPSDPNHSRHNLKQGSSKAYEAYDLKERGTGEKRQRFVRGKKTTMARERHGSHISPCRALLVVLLAGKAVGFAPPTCGINSLLSGVLGKGT
eukprot:627942-Rhodomonas_salina.1